MLTDVTWTCHVCEDERPDDRISVAKGTAIVGERINVGVNVRYCNDRAWCFVGARELVATRVAKIRDVSRA